MTVSKAVLLSMYVILSMLDPSRIEDGQFFFLIRAVRHLGLLDHQVCRHLRRCVPHIFGLVQDSTDGRESCETSEGLKNPQ